MWWISMTIEDKEDSSNVISFPLEDDTQELYVCDCGGIVFYVSPSDLGFTVHCLKCEEVFAECEGEDFS